MASDSQSIMACDSPGVKWPVIHRVKSPVTQRVVACDSVSHRVKWPVAQNKVACDSQMKVACVS